MALLKAADPAQFPHREHGKRELWETHREIALCMSRVPLCLNKGEAAQDQEPATPL